VVNLLSEGIAEKGLPWQPVFRKGYVAFKRSGGYITLVADLSWCRPVRFAVKLPESPAEMSLVNPYPDLKESWGDQDREWG